ncbi:hypothetical protein [Enterobacter cancerogenus]|uniref:hypothetical protein n=1 Tax=Enterobacter cancerogenus TaxID=69218 RepID=UPI00235FFCA9|nr:hypothetical protein [Enterobacter cancerogenus]
MRLSQTFTAPLLITLLLAGCQSRKTLFPPLYNGTPQEISSYEVKGLIFVTTVTFGGLFAEESVREYAEKNHYRYYVVTMHRNDFKAREERITAMMYR